MPTARQALADQSFDVLLVDYDLDDGKGDELVKELRASAKAVTVIGVSSHDGKRCPPARRRGVRLRQDPV